MFWLPHMPPFFGVAYAGFSWIVGAVRFRDCPGPSTQACNNPVDAMRKRICASTGPRVVGSLPHLLPSLVEVDLKLLEVHFFLKLANCLLQLLVGFILPVRGEA